MGNESHIVFISSWYPTPEDPTLGIFNHYFALAAARYNTVTVLIIRSASLLKNAPEISVDTHKGIRTVTVNYQKVPSRLPFFSALKRHQRVIAAFDAGWQTLVKNFGQPDLIHLNVAMPMGIGVLHLHHKYKIPFVLNENWSGYCEEDGNYKGFIQTHFTKKIVAAASCIMPTSTFLRDAMLRHGLQGNYRVVPNVVDCDIFQPLQMPPHQGTNLIHISSLNDREKNVSGLIRAFAAASSKINDLHLTIVGQGPDRKAYEALVKELLVDKQVKFSGRVFSDELVRQINAADALVMFSHYETFCLVNVEAFACGKPVITSAAGGIKTYMRPEFGIMVPPANEAALTQAILEFVATKANYDSKIIRQYACDYYSYEVVGRDLSEIYNAALKKISG